MEQNTQLTVKNLFGKDEVWVKIPSLRGYEASSFGRVKSLERWILRSRGGTQRKREKILKFYLNGKYLTVNISVDGKTRTHYVHRLIAEAFHGSCPKGFITDHDDNNPLNNYPDNLKYITQRKNVHKNGKQSKHGRGVSLSNGTRFRARIRIDGKQVNLGCYDTTEEAQQAFNNKLKELCLTN